MQVNDQTHAFTLLSDNGIPYVFPPRPYVIPYNDYIRYCLANVVPVTAPPLEPIKPPDPVFTLPDETPPAPVAPAVPVDGLGVNAGVVPEGGD